MNKAIKNSDFIGFINSTICIVHCLLMPSFYVFFPFLESLSFSIFKLDYLFLFISFLSVFNSTNNTPSVKLIVALWIAFLFLAIGVLFEEDFLLMHLLTYFGSFGLVILHLINIRICKIPQKNK